MASIKIEYPAMDNQPRQRGLFGLGATATGMLGRAGSVGVGVMAILFALFWLGISGTMFGLIISQLLGQIWVVATYQSVEATVAQYTPRDESGDDTQPAKIAYRYEVGGRPYEGVYTAPADQLICDEYTAALLRPLASGDPLAAWYDPRQPEKSTLAPVIEPTMMAILMFVTPFVMVGLGMAYAGIKIILAAARGLDVSGPMSMGAGGEFIISYFVFSTVGAIGIGLLSAFLDWRVAVGLGLAVWLIGVPAACVLVVRGIGRWRKKEAADAAAPESALAAQAATVPTTGESRSSRVNERKMMPLFALFWCSITGVFVGFVVWTVWRQLDAQRRFEPTPGVVLSSRVTSSSDSDGTTYSPSIRYSYSVVGQDYVSTRYSFGDMGSSGGSHARSVVAVHPVGKRVTVYYDPDKPSEAVLTLEVPPMMWFMSLFLQPFILIGIGLIAAIVVGVVRRRRIQAFLAEPLKPPCHVPAWGRLEMGRDGFTVRPGPPVSGLLVSFAGGYGLTCFLSIFVLAFAVGGFESDPAAVKVALAVAACVGVASAVWTLVKGNSDGMLQLNDSAGRLTVARRKAPVDIAIAEIDHWTVRTVPSKWKNKSGPDKMELQLTAVLSGGREVSVRRFPGDEEESFALARAMGEWFAGVTRKPFKPDEA